MSATARSTTATAADRLGATTTASMTLSSSATAAASSACPPRQHHRRLLHRAAARPGPRASSGAVATPSRTAARTPGSAGLLYRHRPLARQNQPVGGKAMCTPTESVYGTGRTAGTSHRFSCRNTSHGDCGFDLACGANPRCPVRRAAWRSVPAVQVLDSMTAAAAQNTACTGSLRRQAPGPSAWQTPWRPAPWPAAASRARPGTRSPRASSTAPASPTTTTSASPTEAATTPCPRIRVQAFALADPVSSSANAVVANGTPSCSPRLGDWCQSACDLPQRVPAVNQSSDLAATARARSPPYTTPDCTDQLDAQNACFGPAPVHDAPTRGRAPRRWRSTMCVTNHCAMDPTALAVQVVLGRRRHEQRRRA